MDIQFLIKHKYFLLCLIPNFLVFFSYYEGYIKSRRGTIPFKNLELVNNASLTETKYLVEMPNCKIPDIDPFNSDIWPYYQKEEYLSCTKTGLLTYIDKNETTAYLRINSSLIDVYISENKTWSCCYMDVTRGIEDDKDNVIDFSECLEFEDATIISSDLIKVICINVDDEEEIYSNVHSIVRPTEEILNRYKSNNLFNPFNILLIGIDTMSQLNFIRTMPKTQQYLLENNWINMKGYNKIDDNTFPNLMAILTGKNLSQIDDICDPENVPLNDCNLIWDTFEKNGYVTAYAEDEAFLNTFSYLMKGFDEPPTDHYFRPYSLAVESLDVVKKYLLSYCTGPETSGERILNLIKDLYSTYTEMPKFGLFWMNSFSHNNINTASSMDEVFANFLKYLRDNHHLDETFVIFFSDHGFRFGKVRYTYSGWLEERLPFNYIHVPKTFQELFPDYYKNLVANSNKLTTPFDLYLTLQNILYLSSNNFHKIEASLACPKCKSLFQNVNDDRSCSDASIAQHFCTCMGHFYIDPNSAIVKKAAYFALDKLRSTINIFGDKATQCATYYLRRVISSGVTETFYNNRNESFNYLLIIFETIPKAVFEATVSTTNQNSIPLFSLQGMISRIDRYGDKGNCVDDPILRKYCYCDGFLTQLQKTMNILFNT